MTLRATRSRRVADTATLSLFDERAPAGDSVAPPQPAAPPAIVDAAQVFLAEAFADHVVRWAERAGAPTGVLGLLRHSASQVSIATSSGHACIELGRLAATPGDVDTLRRALVASCVVGNARAPGALPLVLDDGDRLYLNRYFDYEQRIAARVMHAMRAAPEASAREPLSELLATLFADAPTDRVDWQKLAVCLAVQNRFTVISGGPGTGKTTTVVNLLACLVALEPDCRIALAAPTGKAAARMQDALRQRASHLPESIRARLPAESFTIHRLLGVTPGRAFMHDAAHPLPYDVVVIDEASMLDLALAAKLFEAVPASARIVLLGDKDQLAAVESGAVFSELSADPRLSATCIARLASLTGIARECITPPAVSVETPLRDCAVWLTENFRFGSDSGIGRIAANINRGEAAQAIEWLRSGDASVTWIDDAGWTLDARAIDAVTKGYDAYLDRLAAGADDRAAVFDAFDRYRILCAQRETPRGVHAINEVLDRRCRERLADRWPAAAHSPWYAGRPVLIGHNDYVLKVYNGDVGIALPDDAGNLLVYFRETNGTLRGIAPMRLPQHETAFATTVHKAQGSEFDAVALLLPAKPSALLTRELVYTAVTRARRHVTIVTGEHVLEHAICTATMRHSGLHARLREAAASGV